MRCKCPSLCAFPCLNVRRDNRSSTGGLDYTIWDRRRLGLCDCGRACLVADMFPILVCFVSKRWRCTVSYQRCRWNGLEWD